MNDALTHRIEQLLAKHAALLQTNEALKLECADLKNRHQLANQRLEALIAKLATTDSFEPAL